MLSQPIIIVQGIQNTTELPQDNRHFDKESNLVPQSKIRTGEAKTSQIRRIIKVNTFVLHYSLLCHFFRLGLMIPGHPTRLPASEFEAGKKKKNLCTEDRVDLLATRRLMTQITLLHTGTL